MSLDPATIYRDGFTSVADVVETTRRWGIIAFPAFVLPDLLARMNDELDLMIRARRDIGAHVDEYENIINLRLDRETYTPAFPASLGFFGQNFMREIAAIYFAPEDFKLNRQISASVLSETKTRQIKPPFALHFDKRQCLKFYVYLSDTNERNGAIRAPPGTILRNRAVCERAMREVGDMNDINNIIPEPEVPSIPIPGPAGTMFIFDTDVNHGASTVLPGHTRRVLRGHTQSLSMLRKIGYNV